MISSEMLEALSRMNIPMVVFLGEQEEESALLKEMKRHNEVEEERPYIVPSPG